MQPKEFNQIIQQYDEQIKKLENDKETFISLNKESVLKAIQCRKKQNREWFIKNFDKIWKHKELFALGTTSASVIIDFFTIYLYGHCSVGFSVNKISMGNLIKLWKLGFVYKQYPIVQYHDTNTNNSVIYIKDNQLYTEKIISSNEKIFFSKSIMNILKNKKNYIDSELANYRTVDDIKSILEKM